MKILHLTPTSNGYEEVTLLANQVNRRNRLAVIEKDGEVLMTGGLIIHDTPKIREVLDAIERENQYQFVYDMKLSPFVQMYYEND